VKKGKKEKEACIKNKIPNRKVPRGQKKSKRKERGGGGKGLAGKGELFGLDITDEDS